MAATTPARIPEKTTSTPDPSEKAAFGCRNVSETFSWTDKVNLDPPRPKTRQRSHRAQKKERADPKAYP